MKTIIITAVTLLAGLLFGWICFAVLSVNVSDDCGSNGTEREGWLSMTNEKAIELLRRMQEPEAYEPQITEEAFEALELAIRALGTDTNAEDLISRKAVLHALGLWI